MSTLSFISEILQDEYEALSEIHAILCTERSALEKSDMEALERSQSNKQHATEKLRIIYERKMDLLLRNHLPASQEGWIQLIQQIGNPILELSEQWESNHQLLADCAEQNGINGNIIATSKQHNSQLLELLFGSIITNRAHPEKT